MKHPTTTAPMVWFCVVCLMVMPVFGADSTTDERVLLLEQQNELLRAELLKQRELIESLSHEVGELKDARSSEDETAHRGFSGLAGSTRDAIHISGEAAAAFFWTGSDGMFPNAEFRVDEAKLFVDAMVGKRLYGFAEINLATRESDGLDLDVGELYLEIESISQLWGRERQANLRLGRTDVPFGEEYQYRDAIKNPLISHSLSDLWGVDEGIELFGSFGRWNYVAAVQSGGVPVTRDFHADKSITARVSYDPVEWLRVSVSGMRTGSLDVRGDMLSETWFGTGWFRSIGSTNTTRFEAQLAEVDLAVRLPRGHLKAFGGYIRYDDNDPVADNRRDVYYYAVEAVHDVTRKVYAAARFSQIMAQDGFPVVGNGDVGYYLFGPLTRDVWRLSLGAGYRWNPNFVIKTEYAFEQGTETGGGKRTHNDLFAAQAAFRF